MKSKNGTVIEGGAVVIGKTANGNVAAGICLEGQIQQGQGDDIAVMVGKQIVLVKTDTVYSAIDAHAAVSK